MPILAREQPHGLPEEMRYEVKSHRPSAALGQDALRWAAEVIAQADPAGILTDQQAAAVAVNAINRAAKRFRPELGAWEPFVRASMAQDIERCIAYGQHRHPAEALVDVVFDDDEAGAR